MSKHKYRSVGGVFIYPPLSNERSRLPPVLLISAHFTTVGAGVSEDSGNKEARETTTPLERQSKDALMLSLVDTLLF